MSAPDPQTLRSLVDSLSADQFGALRILVNARAAVETPLPEPVSGPAEHRGVPVPEVLRPNWKTAEASWWRAGADAALDVAVPYLDELHNDEPCVLDHHGYCQMHGLPQPGPCPDGQIQGFIAASKGGSRS